MSVCPSVCEFIPPFVSSYVFHSDCPIGRPSFRPFVCVSLWLSTAYLSVFLMSLQAFVCVCPISVSCLCMRYCYYYEWIRRSYVPVRLAVYLYILYLFICLTIREWVYSVPIIINISASVCVCPCVSSHVRAFWCIFAVLYVSATMRTFVKRLTRKYA